jgi:hypothetical protein
MDADVSACATLSALVGKQIGKQLDRANRRKGTPLFGGGRLNQRCNGASTGGGRIRTQGARNGFSRFVKAPALDQIAPAPSGGHLQIDERGLAQEDQVRLCRT